jgi:hypothetical protein
MAAEERIVMARTSTAVALRYEAFWSNLLPLSNRRTGFSIRSPRRQASIEFWRLGFSFSYWLHDDQPHATIRFMLQRSDAETIYEACCAPVSKLSIRLEHRSSGAGNRLLANAGARSTRSPTASRVQLCATYPRSVGWTSRAR